MVSIDKGTTVSVESDLAVLTARVDRNERDLCRLEEEHDEAMTTLRGIDRQLAQIKWILSGAVFTLVAQEVGLLGALKGML
jgi:hypothetical protein